MEIMLIRHAQTASNMLGRYCGATDEPLSEEGVCQAQATKQALRYAIDPGLKSTIEPVSQHAINLAHRSGRVHTSSLARSIRTAQILYPEAEIVTHGGLDEMNFGCFEGRSWKDMENDVEYRTWVDGGCEGTCPAGEGKAAFTIRCVRAFLEIMAEEVAYDAQYHTMHDVKCSSAHDGKYHSAHDVKANTPLPFVVHGGTIMAILSELAMPCRPYFDWKTDFCEGYLLQWVGGSRPLKLIREIHHTERIP